MLYFIGGASRSGKTLLARRLLAEHRLPYLSLDWLMMGFTNGIPEYGIHDKLFPHEIAERLWDFLKATSESMLWTEADHVIEGEALLPELVRELVDAHPGAIRACFLGYTAVTVDDKVQSIRRFSETGNDWLLKESDQYLRDHVVNMVSHSRRIQAGCLVHGLRYFDTSGDFNAALDGALGHLLAAS